ncbi:MAG TPA: trypsin-like peptidase domain-containing protein, partial [Trebonia sp.]
MTSIRVIAEGQQRTFPLGSTVRIGGAPDADVILHSPGVRPYHARVVSIGNRWWLSAEHDCDLWIAGQRVTTMALTSPVTAMIGRSGEATVHLEAIASPPGAAPSAPAQPPVAQSQGARPTTIEPPTMPPVSLASLAERAVPAPPPASPPPPRPAGFGQPGPPAPTVFQPPLQPPFPGPAGPVPPAQPTVTGLTIMGQDRFQVLVTRIGNVQRIFPLGTRVRVGRDPQLELVSANPLVSRECHGVITSDATGATYTDTSRRGTYLNGKRLRGPLRITESVVLRLGDPATGEELGITPPLTSTEIDRNRERRVLRGRFRMIAAAVVIVGAAAALAAFFLTGTGNSASSQSPTPLAGGTPETVLAHAEAATVRLLQGSPASYTGWGSGDILTPTGLILTNAHVADPQAPGLAVAIGEPGSQLEPDPPYLTVELTTGPSSPVVARYRAKPVAVNGYLDFAVIQIYATTSGTPVNPDSLHLPYFTLGNDAAVQLDQPVTTLGFPGVAMSDSITVTNGVISTFIPDPLGHVSDPRFELETTARIAHGNSGGAAVNNAGQLIGVPSLSIPGEGSDTSWRLRSIGEARPLIAAAKAHTPYTSHILVPLSGNEQVTGYGVGASDSQACGGAQSVTLPGTSTVSFAFAYSGAPKGLDLALLINGPGGTTVLTQDGSLPQ